MASESRQLERLTSIGEICEDTTAEEGHFQHNIAVYPVETLPDPCLVTEMSADPEAVTHEDSTNEALPGVPVASRQYPTSEGQRGCSLQTGSSQVTPQVESMKEDA
ncbi:hypothetical protein NDU88_001069 [Pleurodeles waltl]|uniref:Uncharacterized protein n=1 Tax=Pleurodeles waltl TaxID=8319 RepID=A0AAV7UV60_PLEWA|nr:hypothetical protein NDU88_001069 [Pleurodeles waltl]